ncbi:MAG: hypothetical protein AAFP84_22905, partial [Actinomycetota bacterium]
LIRRAGTALVHVRSTSGFLARAAQGDSIVTPIYDVMVATFEACRRDGRLTRADTATAVFHWNLLLDPRDVLDLAEHRGVDVVIAAAALTDDLAHLLDLDAEG